VASRTPRAFLTDLVRRLLRLAERRARPKIPSRTLRRALRRLVLPGATGGVEGVLFIPHYWAVFLHDGRRGFGSKPGAFLVFFRDIRDDPRVAGGFPERASQIRRLTKREFDFWLERNRRHLKAGGDPFEVPMVVVRHVGPAQGAHFFTRGMDGFLASQAAPVARNAFDAYVQEVVDRDRLTDRARAVLRL